MAFPQVCSLEDKAWENTILWSHQYEDKSALSLSKTHNALRILSPCEVLKKKKSFHFVYLSTSQTLADCKDFFFKHLTFQFILWKTLS